MLQKEVVDRMAAGPGDNNYGRLSVMTQYLCQVIPLFIVPPESFDPPPKVDSAIVRLVPRAEVDTLLDEAFFATVVRTAFNQRRKTLRNSLKPLLQHADIAAIGIDLSLRPENISVAEYVALANHLVQVNQAQ
jgi:16S rRNA (adenine1518-N6/adenine1519-N6)-dimethyltransferase